MRRLLILAFALVLAACTAEDAADTTTAPSPAATGTEDAPDTTASDTTTTTAPPTTTTAAVAGGDECLVGSWTLDSEAFIANFDDIMAQAGMGDTEVTALDGTFVVEMNGDGTYRAVRDEWGFSMATSEGTVVIEINGEESGTWSADGSTLSIDPVENDLTVDASVEVDGQVVPLPEAPVETPPGLASNGEFTCSDDVLIVTNAGVESVMNRN